MAYPNILGEEGNIVVVMHLMNAVLLIYCLTGLVVKFMVLTWSSGRQNKDLCDYWLGNPTEVDNVSPGIDGQLVL